MSGGTFNIPEDIADQVVRDVSALHLNFDKDLHFLYYIPSMIGISFDTVIKNVVQAITKDILTPAEASCCCSLFKCMFGWMYYNKDKADAMYRYIKLIENDDNDIKAEYIRGKTCFYNMVGQASTSRTSSLANKLAYAFYTIHKIMIHGRNPHSCDDKIYSDYHQMRLMVVSGTWLGEQLSEYYLFK